MRCVPVCYVIYFIKKRKKKKPLIIIIDGGCARRPRRRAAGAPGGASVDLRQTLGDGGEDGLGETALAAAAAYSVGGKGAFVVAMQRTLEAVERKIIDTDELAEQEHARLLKNSPAAGGGSGDGGGGGGGSSGVGVKKLPPQPPSRWNVTAAKKDCGKVWAQKAA